MSLPGVIGHLRHPMPDAQAAECFDTLLQAPGCRIERIVSHGQASPPDFWYDQNWDEWVLLITGWARLRLASQPEALELKAGDYLWIPAHERHRVEATDSTQPTLWLAVHWNEPSVPPGDTQVDA